MPPGIVAQDQPPETPISQETIKALLAEGDQPRSAEVDLGGGLRVTAGVRNLYLNLDGAGVAVCPCTWR